MGFCILGVHTGLGVNINQLWWGKDLGKGWSEVKRKGLENKKVLTWRVEQQTWQALGEPRVSREIQSLWNNVWDTRHASGREEKRMLLLQLSQLEHHVRMASFLLPKFLSLSENSIEASFWAWSSWHPYPLGEIYTRNIWGLNCCSTHDLRLHYQGNKWNNGYIATQSIRGLRDMYLVALEMDAGNWLLWTRSLDHASGPTNKRQIAMWESPGTCETIKLTQHKHPWTKSPP